MALPQQSNAFTAVGQINLPLEVKRLVKQMVRKYEAYRSRRQESDPNQTGLILEADSYWLNDFNRTQRL